MATETDERTPAKTGLSEAERKRRQRSRSIAIALILAGLVVLFYIVTIIQMSSNVPTVTE